MTGEIIYGFGKTAQRWSKWYWILFKELGMLHRSGTKSYVETAQGICMQDWESLAYIKELGGMIDYIWLG